MGAIGRLVVVLFVRVCLAQTGTTLNSGDVDFSAAVPFRPQVGGEAASVSDLAPGSVLDRIEQFDVRPPGPWEIVTEARVPTPAPVVWEDLKFFGSFISNALQNLAVNFRAQDDDNMEWIVDLNSGEKITFTVTETAEEEKSHVFIISSHSIDVFPGLGLTGSPMFVQVHEVDGGTGAIELGWGGPRIDGPKDVALTQMKGLLDQMVENLKRRFGEICNDKLNIRTIEGDCNNLGNPRVGASGHALGRLSKHDPAFPDGTGDIPSGATDISPRLISNMVFQQSPGTEILLPILESLEGECAQQTVGGVKWEICPFGSAKATMGRENIVNAKWAETESKGSELVMKFKAKKCNVEAVFACNGEVGLDLAKDPCKSKTNRFFHPKACIVAPGEDAILMNSDGLTDMFWSFGQFIDHDVGLTPVSQLSESRQPGFSTTATEGRDKDQLPISVPKDDPFFDSKQTLEFERSIFSKRGEGQSHINQLSAFLDLGQVYGDTNLRARALRTFVDGKLRTSEGNFPPFNKISGSGALRAKLENAPDAEDRFYAVGDIRGNEQSVLLSLHILFLREHNLICDELKVEFPEWEDVMLYQVARAINIAAYQSIAYVEWLPKLLGEGAVPADAVSYNPGADPTLTAIFSTAYFRFGHSMVGSFLWALGSGPREEASLELIPLREAFFNPELVKAQGIDRFLRGAAWHPAKEIDNKVVDELRNFLFTENSEAPEMDLIALNIQRGRDMGLPSHNKVRDAYGLPEFGSIFDMTSDESLAYILNGVYKGDPNNVDAFVGGLVEDHLEGAAVGQTIHTVLKDQFTRIRDADRFFYKLMEFDESLLSAYPRLQAILNDKVKLRDIIIRNTKITGVEIGGGRSVFTLT
ncbi:hypothetical protein BSKO_04127 [Bryopsis sp. KO-2023]|nr:hypothetical protein BSKO_04127 [Bryopsis sp. KO-2023]